MVALAPLITAFILGGVVYTTLSYNNQTDISTKVITVKQVNLDNIAMSALDIAKEAIKKGSYETTTIFYVDNKDIGYTYLKSISLNQTINNLQYSTISKNTNDNTTISIGYKISNNIINVLIKASKDSKDIFLGAQFTLVGATNILPLAYAGSGTIVGGSMCTMGYDTTNHVLGNVLNPDFNFYLDNKFSASPTFTIPKSAPNKKDLQVHANVSVAVTAYKTIDKVYAVGDIYLQNGATVGEAVATGSVLFKDRTSSAGTKVSGANYQYPDINTTFTNNTYSYTSTNADTTKKDSIVCGVNACNDLAALSCSSATNPYSAGSNSGNAWDYGYNIATNSNTCSTIYSYSSTYKNACVAGYSAKSNYNTCVSNAQSTSTCIDKNTVSLPAGNYDNLVIGNNCNLDLTGSQYTFTNVNVNNNANMTFTNKDVTFNANNINVKNNSTFTYTGINPNSYMIMSSNNMALDNNSGVICTDPRQCLLDTNTFSGSNNSIVQGSLLGRDTIYLRQSNIYGNMIGETVDSNGTKICNILDDNGNQMLGNSYFDIAAGNNLQTNKVAQILGQVLCNSYTDCIAKMNNQNL